MPSVDIVSEIETAEILNATDNTERELATRFDFRGVDASIKFANDIVTIKTEADFQCQQLLDIFRGQLIKRKVDPRVIECEDESIHRGKTFTLDVTFKQGISAEICKKNRQTHQGRKAKGAGDYPRGPGANHRQEAG